MTLTEIHSMAADALAGEQLQVKNGPKGSWQPADINGDVLFHPAFTWRINPTIEVNGVLMSKRQAKAEWEASGATSYEFNNNGTWWLKIKNPAPILYADTQYRWTKPKWIYVNGVAIVPEGGNARYYGYYVANVTDGLKLGAAIAALMEAK